jgi:hypothetical protein
VLRDFNLKNKAAFSLSEKSCAKLENQGRKKIFRSEKKLILRMFFDDFETKLSEKPETLPKFFRKNYRQTQKYRR